MEDAVSHKGTCFALSAKKQQIVQPQIELLFVLISLSFSLSLSFLSTLFLFLALFFPVLGAIMHSTGNELSLWPHGIERPSQTVCPSVYALLTVQKHLQSVF